MKTPPQNSLKKVLFLFDLASGYNEGVLIGIGRYARVVGNWRCMGVTSETVTTLSHTQKPHGIIASFRGPRGPKAIANWRVPTVEVNDAFAPGRFPRVFTDHAAVGRLIGEHLRQCGLQHFGFAGDLSLAWTQPRLDGLLSALRQTGPTCQVFNSADFARPEASWFGANREFCVWVAKLPKPVGLVGANDHWALRLLDACHHRHIRVPTDAAVIGVDNHTSLCSLAEPPLSSVALDADRIGYMRPQRFWTA